MKRKSKLGRVHSFIWTTPSWSIAKCCCFLYYNPTLIILSAEPKYATLRNWKHEAREGRENAIGPIVALISDRDLDNEMNSMIPQLFRFIKRVLSVFQVILLFLGGWTANVLTKHWSVSVLPIKSNSTLAERLNNLIAELSGDMSLSQLIQHYPSQT